MDVEKLAVFAGISFAIGVGAFVLWGPTPRPRKRGRVSGIVNLGYTCFLNSLLQALAACPTFTCWLKAQDKKRLPSSFTNQLIAVIDRINGYSKDLDGDIVPTDVIATLGSLWKFDPGHQDAHELLHIILSAIQSDVQFTNRAGCLSDALPSNPEMCEINTPQGHSVHKYLASEESMQTGQTENFTEASDRKYNSTLKSSAISICGFRGNKEPGVIFARPSNMLDRLPSCNPIHENSKQGTLRSFMTICPQSNSVLLHEMPPFSGLLTSQLKCTNCNWKSSVRYDKLATVSLPLPPAGEVLKWRRHTLSELFGRLVTSEVIHNVDCDGCASRCLAIRTLTLGKLPKCLCLHIPRTIWSNSGVPLKRDDPVIFPEILILDPFTFVESIKRNVQAVLPMMLDNNLIVNHAKHKYRLQAVVEHRGPVDAGHFVCYRRGHHSGQWLYTSDSIVENIPLTNVLCANPYLLFYERILDKV